MKKVIFSLAVATALLSSCKKDEICNYSVDIKNSCSGNVKTWFLSQEDWMDAYVGSNYCITNTESW